MTRVHEVIILAMCLAFVMPHGAPLKRVQAGILLGLTGLRIPNVSGLLGIDCIISGTSTCVKKLGGASFTTSAATRQLSAALTAQLGSRYSSSSHTSIITIINSSSYLACAPMTLAR
jgi:hypothetical protein